MRVLRFFVTAVVFFIAVFFVGGFFLPDAWMVSRSITIHATPEKIYPFVSNFKEWEKWSPWNASKDPSLKYTYEGPDSGAGAKQSWTSEKMGTGWMQFTAANPQTGVAYDLFIDMGRSQTLIHGSIVFVPKGNETQVIWTDQGDSGKNYMKRWMSFLLKFMLGKDLDTGLSGLAQLVEKS